MKHMKASMALTLSFLLLPLGSLALGADDTDQPPRPEKGEKWQGEKGKRPPKGERMQGEDGKRPPKGEQMQGEGGKRPPQPPKGENGKRPPKPPKDGQPQESGN